jgi:signal transduction histidine kinase
MYKRLIILSVIIFAALCGLVWMGYHSIQIRAKGMEDVRQGDFAAVAEQIRQDVKRKLDEFMQTEQNRPYTDYQYYYVPENVVRGQQQMAVLRSPLGGRLEHGLAYGNFQVEPDGNIITPNDNVGQRQNVIGSENDLYAKAILNRRNIEDNLLPVLSGTTAGSFKMNFYNEAGVSLQPQPKELEQVQLANDLGLKSKGAKTRLSQGQRGKNYPIESLQSQDQKPQVIQQKRSVLERNIASNTASELQQAMQEGAVQGASQAQAPQSQATQTRQVAEQNDRQLTPTEISQAETIQVRIEPFVPLVVPGGEAEGDTTSQEHQFIFGGQVFLLRHVQIENKHFLQGFRLNEKKLIEEIEESASRYMRKGMGFELSQNGNGRTNGDVAHAAVLDFGFGDLVLNLREIDPHWIGRQINNLRYWYFSIISVVLLAVTLGLASLWRNARAQIRLAQKKDDFISAVSHELRTPLTSIRMYSEMLEKNWVKSEDKVAEYYGNMRQESERLSRLIENVLDFSRIQRGRKKYAFNAGDMNKCVADVVEMMKPYALLKGFSIKTELGRLEQSVFDSDAVTQIVVNLLDNAVKYARNAEDKTITVRTGSDKQFILIEVEDHGPGIPRRQQEKIFEEFYRSGAEATRETTGTGLGLALVKKFAEAHNGFVEIINAKPTGAIFRVALAAQV